MNIVRNNPNAAVATGGVGAGTALVAILAACGVVFPPVVAAAIAGAVPIILLAIGRRGIRGIVRMVWRGSEDETEEGV